MIIIIGILLVLLNSTTALASTPTPTTTTTPTPPTNEILSLSLIYNDINTGQDTPIVFTLYYNDITTWNNKVNNFCNDLNISKCNILIDAVYNKLIELSFDHIIIEQGSYDNNNTIDSYFNQLLYSDKIVQNMDASLLLLDTTTTNATSTTTTTNTNENSKLLFTIGHGKDSRRFYNNYINNNLVNVSSLLPEYLRQNDQKIILYQTRNAITGGTIALQLLYERLYYLGYNTLLCDESNYQSLECTNINDNSLVITGEWCHEILDDFNVSKFAGRGIQYFLGFHHSNDYCRGHVAMADSHYIAVDLDDHYLGAYYLGCAMTPHFEKAHKDMIHDDSHVNDMILKEDLIIIDYDYVKDYPPLSCCSTFHLPSNYKVVFAKDIPRHQMPALLKRAKIVLDLAMPGPERLAGEGILMGAVPIISSRWNGASYVDFPGILKVDHQNQSDIESKLNFVIDNYQKLTTDENYLVFYSYIKSMWQRITNTADVVFSSSRIHFVLFAHNLIEEHKASLQCLALLHLFPLASIDLFVTDRFWFMRHHYKFYTILKNAGYIRYDPHNPVENKYMVDNNYLGLSFVNILQFSSDKLDDTLIKLFTYQDIPWKPLIVFIPNGLVFTDPYSLLHSINHLDNKSGVLSEVDDDSGLLAWNSCSSQTRKKALLVQPSASIDSVKHIIYSIVGEPSTVDNQVCHDSKTITFKNSSRFTTICSLYHTSSSDFISIHTDFVFGVTKTPSWYSLIYTLDHIESMNIC